MLTPSPDRSSEGDETEQNQSQIYQRPDLQLDSFRWVEFEESMKRSYQQLREKRMFNDVTISCENSEVEAHKIVLATSSNFFSRLLQRSSFRNNHHPIIFINDVKMKHLKLILDFMYTGKVKVPRNDTIAVLQAAEELEIKGFKADDLNPVESAFGKRRATEFSSSSIWSSPEKRSRSDSWSPIPSSSTGSSPIRLQPKINLNESSFLQENDQDDSQEKDKHNTEDGNQEKDKENTEDGNQEKDKENRQDNSTDDSQEKDKEDRQENAEDDSRKKDKENRQEKDEKLKKDQEDIEENDNDDKLENTNQDGSQEKDKENRQENSEDDSQEKDKEDKQENAEDDSQKKDKEDSREKDEKLEKDQEDSEENDNDNQLENTNQSVLELSELSNAVILAKVASNSPSSDEKIDRETKRAALVEKVGSGMFKCKQCEYTSKAVFNVKKHAEGHLSPRKYKCHLCPSVVKNEFYFKAHMKAKHGIKLKTVNAEDEKLKKGQEDSEENDNDDRVENLNQSVVEPSQLSNAETPREYKCNVCQSVLKNEVYFKAHMKTNHRINLKTACWLKKE